MRQTTKRPVKEIQKAKMTKKVAKRAVTVGVQESSSIQGSSSPYIAAYICWGLFFLERTDSWNILTKDICRPEKKSAHRAEDSIFWPMKVSSKCKARDAWDSS